MRSRLPVNEFLRHIRNTYRTFDFQVTGGAEIRALSAIDLALWDLLGKSLNLPVYRLLGGRSNPEVRLYNTCFTHKYDFEKEPEKILRELIDRYGIKGFATTESGMGQKSGCTYCTRRA